MQTNSWRLAMLSYRSTQDTHPPTQRFLWRVFAIGAVLALVAISGCKQQSAALANAGIEDAGQAAAPAARPIRVEQIRFSRMQDGRAVPLGNTPLVSDQTLRIAFSFAGQADPANIEIRVGDTHGNGIFRDARSVKIVGHADFSYVVPPPAGGWV